MSKERWYSGSTLRTAHELRCCVGWKSKKNLTEVSAGTQSTVYRETTGYLSAKKHFSLASLALRPYAYASSFFRFIDHTQRCTTFVRIPWTRDQLVAETSSGKKHNNHNKHPCPTRDSNPQS